MSPIRGRNDHDVSTATRAMLLLRTLPALQWRQVVYRGVRRAQSSLAGVPGFRVAGLVTAPSWRGAEHLQWIVAAERPDAIASRRTRADELLRDEFRFLNHTEVMASVNWRARVVSHLWTYQLHYGEWALDLAWAAHVSRDARYADRAIMLMTSWIHGTDPGVGDGWAPYPISVRLDRWLRALALLQPFITASALDLVLQSLAAQADHLLQRLEYHVQGNHLLVNYAGLCMAGLFCEGPAATRWQRVGQRGLEREVAQQVLADGGHYERSPTYHASILADVLRVLAAERARGVALSASVRVKARAMLGALHTLYRPDGTPHLFSDATLDMAPSPDTLRALAIQADVDMPAPPPPVSSLPDSGYYVCVRDDGSRLITDCGDLGPMVQAAHGHCDMLSFEYDVAGVPLIVDSGLHGYEGDPFRAYARSTSAHNTVAVNGREQSELWATFRVARRARVGAVSVSGTADHYCLEGSCRPFHDLRMSHHRTIRWTDELHVQDIVTGADGAWATSYLHVHPAWTATPDGTTILLAQGQDRMVLEPFGIDHVELVRGSRTPIQGWYLPAFGTAIPATCVVMTVKSISSRPFGFQLRRVTAHLSPHDPGTAGP